jgi:hypothetical protein
MKSVDLKLILFIVDKAYVACRVDVGFSVRPTSLRVLLRVRTASNLKLEKNLTSSKLKVLRSSSLFLRLVNPIVYIMILTRTSEYCTKGCYGRRGRPGSRSTHSGLSCPLRYIHVTSMRLEGLPDSTQLSISFVSGIPNSCAQTCQPSVSHQRPSLSLCKAKLRKLYPWIARLAGSYSNLIVHSWSDFPITGWSCPR